MWPRHRHCHPHVRPVYRGVYYPPVGAYPPGGAYPPTSAYPPTGQIPPPSLTQPVYNPTVPYVGPLPRLSDGHIIKINGQVPHHSHRFHINLCLGPGTNEQVDHALHLNARFDGWNSVVRNSFLGHSWGIEESSGGNPLIKGQNFECIILVTNMEYKIAFNGVHFAEFRHRTPKENVTHLNIGDEVTVTSIIITDPVNYAPPPPPPPVCPPAPQPPPPQPQPPPASVLPMPYKTPIPGGLHPGKMIIINGTPQATPDRFAINLCYYEYDTKDVALHFNPRFPEKRVVRNTMCGSNWGKEETKYKGPFPFMPNVPFQMMILVEHDKYKVAVNGAHFIEYEHRLRNLSMVRYILINGHLHLTSVSFQ